MLVKHSVRTVRQPCPDCGTTELYRAHDTDKPYPVKCHQCGVTGEFVLINKDGTLHDCQNKDSKVKDIIPKDYPWEKALKDDLGKVGETVTVIEEKKEVSKMPAQTGTPDVQAALAVLAGAFGPQIDRGEIETMVKEAVSNVVYPTRTVIEKTNGERKELSGAQHYKLGDVITALMAEEHVLMVGPAGTGKSTIAEQAAEALGLASYSISLSPQTPASQLVGYMQATGEYVRSLFREAYEKGGVFHFDEMDNAHPSVLAVINAALANGQMAFPDKMVKRHSDFRAVASANTYGRGANRSYVGRQAIDAATLDRFSVETVDVDESLENELCHSVGLETAQVERVLKFVRKIRKNVEIHKMPLVISPRASMGMVRLLQAGRSWESAVDARVRRGMSDTEWDKVSK